MTYYIYNYETECSFVYLICAKLQSARHGNWFVASYLILTNKLMPILSLINDLEQKKLLIILIVVLYFSTLSIYC